MTKLKFKILDHRSGMKAESRSKVLWSEMGYECNLDQMGERTI